MDPAPFSLGPTPCARVTGVWRTRPAGSRGGEALKEEMCTDVPVCSQVAVPACAPKSGVPYLQNNRTKQLPQTLSMVTCHRWGFSSRSFPRLKMLSLNLQEATFSPLMRPEARIR